MFQINNNIVGYGNRPNGFETDNRVINENWRTLLNEIAQDGANTYNTGNFTQHTAHPKTDLLIWAWDKIFKEMEGSRYFAFTTVNRNFSQNDVAVAADNYDPTRRTINDYQLLIDIQVVKKGMDFIKILGQRYKDKRMAAIESLLTTERYHQISVLKIRDNHIAILTNRFDSTWFPKLMSLLPAFFPCLAPISNNPESKARIILKALFENNTDVLESIIMKECEEIYALRDARIKESLIRLLKEGDKNRIEMLLKNIRTKQKEIDQYFNAIENMQSQINSWQYEHIGMLTSTEINTDSVFEFLKNNKSIKLIDCQNGYISWEIKTPILNYNKKDVEMYFKPNSGANVINKPDWFGVLIHDTFVKEKYRMLTTQIINMPWNPNNSWSTLQDTDDRFGNQHISRYNCFGSTKTAIVKAMQNKDLILVLNLLISACATITFTDHAVITSMATKLQNNHYNLPVFEDIATGEILSAHQIRNKLEGVPETTQPEPEPIEDENEDEDEDEDEDELTF